MRDKLEFIVSKKGFNPFTSYEPYQLMPDYQRYYNSDGVDEGADNIERLAGDHKDASLSQSSTIDTFYATKSRVHEIYRDFVFDPAHLALLNALILDKSVSELRTGDLSRRRLDSTVYHATDGDSVPNLLEKACAQYYATIEDDAGAQLIALFKFVLDLILIAPFDDGNYRLARLALEIGMLQQGYRIVHGLDLEQWFVHKQREISSIIDASSKAYVQMQGNYAQAFVDALVAFFSQQYALLARNYNFLKTTPIDAFKADEMMIYYLLTTKHDELTGNQIFQYVDGLFMFPKHKAEKMAAEFLKKYVKAGYLVEMKGIDKSGVVSVQSYVKTNALTQMRADKTSFDTMLKRVKGGIFKRMFRKI